MSTVDSGVYLLESDVDESLAERKHARDKSSRAMSSFPKLSPSPSPRIGGRSPLRTSHSAPPSLSTLSLRELAANFEGNAAKNSDDPPEANGGNDSDDDVIIAIHPTRLTRASSTGNNYGITGIGRGFDWKWEDESDDDEDDDEKPEIRDSSDQPTPPANDRNGLQPDKANFIIIPPTPEAPRQPQRASTMFVKTPVQTATLGLSLNGVTPAPPPPGPRSAGLQRTFSYSGSSTPAEFSPFHSPKVRSPNLSPSASSHNLPGLSSPQLGCNRNPSRVSRSRSNQSRRVSVVSGRQVPVARMPSPPPDPSPAPPPLTPRLARLNSTTSFISIASTAATAPPSPGSDGHAHYLGGRSIENFMILGEAGRGAYGMVKRAREFKVDGSLGVRNHLLLNCLC